jgi:hypothetical protein
MCHESIVQLFRFLHRARMSKQHSSPLSHDFTKPDMPNADFEAIEDTDLSVWDCVSRCKMRDAAYQTAQPMT